MNYHYFIIQNRLHFNEQHKICNIILATHIDIQKTKNHF